MVTQPELTTGLVIGIVAIPFVVCALGALSLIFRWRRWEPFERALGYASVVLSGVCLVLSGVLAVNAPAIALKPGINLPLLGDVGSLLLVDSLSIYFILIVNLIAFVASWNSIAYLRDRFPRRERRITVESTEQNDTSRSNRRNPTGFHTLVNLFHFTMVLVPLADNLILLWIAIEATTLVSTVLFAFDNKRESWEAAWKYLIITSTGIIFALLGTMFLANAAKGLAVLREGPIADVLIADPNAIMNWTFLMDHVSLLSKDFVALSFLFIVVGYGTKAGLAPMHTWLPDGHGEAPSPISALLSGVLLKSALYAILRFYTLTNAKLGNADFTSTALLVAGLLSLLVATPFILKSNKFKRVLAYHSLEHMGIITFGIGIGGEIALFGALLHTLNHAVTKSLMFLSFGDVLRRYERIGVAQTDIRGVLRSMPITGGILALGGLALVGTPPFNIFMSELIILWGALSRVLLPVASSKPPPIYASSIPNWVTLGAVALFMISTTLIFYGLVRHLAQVLLHKADYPAADDKATGVEIHRGSERPFHEPVLELAPLLILLTVVILFGVWIWPPLSQLISNGVTIVLTGKG
ncbi:MAG: hypothetical protein M1546_02885 [Chloroflexi bacterium]|nr:hypothetical protein [Chloroflexota bacterium]